MNLVVSYIPTNELLFTWNINKVREHIAVKVLHTSLLDGFGGLVVSILASGTQVCGFNPSRSRWIFRT